ncbi:RES domain-containing protein [Jannaschia pagri]|uniref:RES domain-containing protein n=1 Tax=Jannaschia TaxID=188905 RepID=UPI0035711475
MCHRDPVYRGLGIKYQNEPYSAEGARKYGGRFNRPGVPALYPCTSAEAVIAEVRQAGPLEPTVFVQFTSQIEGLLDLTDVEVRGRCPSPCRTWPIQTGGGRWTTGCQS